MVNQPTTTHTRTYHFFPLFQGTTISQKVFLWAILLIKLIMPLEGCSLIPKTQVEAQINQKNSEKDPQGIAVDIGMVRMGVLESQQEYPGTTKPFQSVILRSRVEGQLLSLAVNVGNQVTKGQILAQLDDSLLATEVAQAQAELAALESEVAQAKARESDAHTQLERARAEQQQALNDASRFSKLAKEGAIARQEAEFRQTTAKIAQQAVISAQQQVTTAQQAIAAALGRVAAQKAVVNQHRQRQAYSRLVAPINGVVRERFRDEGNLISPGDQVLQLIDLTRVKVEVAISELEITKLYIGQSVKVKLDAFPEQFFMGSVSQISPAADADSRQVPVEVIIPNQEQKISSGLLARVSFQSDAPSRVIVPETAIQGEISAAVFVLQPSSTGELKVEQRLVTTGDRANGKVEIISGLEPGERLVTRTSKPLQDGDAVRLSILSETGDDQ